MDARTPSWLFVIPWRPDSPGGVGQVVSNLAQEMQDGRAYRPLFLINRWESKQFTKLEDSPRGTFSFRLVPLWGTRYRFRLAATALLGAPKGLKRLASFLREHNVEVVNVHFPSLAAMWFCLLKGLRLYRGRLILSFHGADLTNAATQDWFGRWLWRKLFRCADAHVACSESLAARLVEVFGVSPKIHTVRNGLSLERFLSSPDQVGPKLSYSLPKRYIACVATYESKKGLDVLLRAFAEISTTNPGTDLVIVGRSAAKLAELQSLAQQLAIAARVTFLTDLPHQHIAPILKAAELFVLPSRQEPFGIAILEAGALGKPVVASKVGGIPEIITDDSFGLLVPPDDPAALAAAIQRVLGDSNLARRLGENLQARVLQEFSWKRAYEQYIKIASDAEPPPV